MGDMSGEKCCTENRVQDLSSPGGSVPSQGLRGNVWLREWGQGRDLSISAAPTYYQLPGLHASSLVGGCR